MRRLVSEVSLPSEAGGHDVVGETGAVKPMSGESIAWPRHLDLAPYPMTTENNKALVRRLVEEVFNRRNLSVVDELVSPDFVEHEVIPGIPSGREGTRQMFAMVLAAFPDFKGTIDDLIAEGDKVVLRWTWTGTQQGEFLGLPPSGKRMSIGVIDIIQFSNGKAVAHWGQSDMMGLMQQLGPASGSPPGGA